MGDTTIKKVEASSSPRGEMGQEYLVASLDLIKWGLIPYWCKDEYQVLPSRLKVWVPPDAGIRELIALVSGEAHAAASATADTSVGRRLPRLSATRG